MKNRSSLCLTAAALLCAAFSVPVSQAAELVAHYKFEDPANLGLDSSGFGNDADEVIDVAQVEGQFGLGAFFDESLPSSFIKTGGLAGFTGKPGVTLAAWVKLDEATTGFDGIISQDAGACCDNRILLHNGDHKPFINLSEHQDVHIVDAEPVEIDVWTHIAMTGIDVDGEAEARVYVNGILVEGGPYIFPEMDDGSEWNTYLGVGESGTAHRLTGTLDDVRIYEGALTDEEVLGLLTPSDDAPPLIAHFPLDDDGSSADGAFVPSTVTDVEFGLAGANANTGNSASFNGASSVIQHEFSEDLNPDGNFTLTLWAKSNGGAGAWNSPVTSRHDLNPDSQGYLIYDSAPSGSWTFWSGNGEEDGNWQTLDGPEVNVGEWEHVAITYDDEEQVKALYVNGELVAEDENSITPNDTTPFNIGAGQDFGDGFWFDGEIDDIGLWGAALTEDQILRVMEEGVAAVSGAPTGPIFAPGDPVIGGQISEDGTMFEVGLAGTTAETNNWPAGEAPEFAIDGVGQKYLNFGEFNTGVIVTPEAGSTIANQIQLWTANDAEARDPASFEIYGTNEEVEGEGPFALSDFRLIASGELELPSTRNPGGDAELLEENSQSLLFNNSTEYTTYLVVFPTVKDEAAANSMQIAEVQLANVGSVRLLTISRVAVDTNGLTFQVLNREGSVVDKESIVVTVDGTESATTVTDIEGGVLVTYVADPAWLPGSTHTYNLTVKDTNGDSANNSGEGEKQVKDSAMPFNTPLVGPEGEAGLWGVRYIWDAGSPGSTVGAIDLIQSSDDADFAGEVFDTTMAVANHGTGVHVFPDDLPYPEEVEFGDDGLWTGENFVISYKATLRISESGAYTFGAHTDDGFGLRIFGAEFTSVSGAGEIDAIAPNTVIHPAPTGDSNTRAVVTLAAGDYPIEFFWYENGGGDHGELYFAKGEFVDDADTDTWGLVGGEHLVGPSALPFQITDITKAGADVTITWQSTEGAGYTIERATAVQFSTGDFEELQDGFEGQAGDTTSYTDSGFAEGEGYYRVKAE